MNNEQIPSNLYDLDIERSILSSIFFNEDAFSEVFGIIDDKDFYLKAHADIFKAMMSCYSHDEPIDIGFVKKRLENNELKMFDTPHVRPFSLLIDNKKIYLAKFKVIISSFHYYLHQLK